jgi:cytochrome b6-f complex iron-sulfur subunit
MSNPPTEPVEELDRRAMLGKASSVAMGCGLAAGYGTLALYAARYIYPTHPRKLEWQFVTSTDRLQPGQSMRYESPAGESITITRRTGADGQDEFLALSSVCPHLGCKVHWEGQKNQFFCPCHNGAFDPTGTAIAGPPKEAGQSLKKYEIRVEANGVVFVLVPTDLLG